MLLAIDVGNTNTVMAIFKEDALFRSWRCCTVAQRSADEYALFFKGVLELAHLGFEDVSDVIVSSVVPAADFHVKRFCERYLTHTPYVVTSDAINLPVLLDQPREVGADRLVNACAVRAEQSLPAIVIDFGTATTFDVIDASGAYAGGVIAPGVNLSLEALQRAAAKLPSVDIKKTSKVIGTNTIDAIQSGMFWGYMGLIEGIVSRMKTEISGAPVVIATGGLASLYAPLTDAIDRVDADLTLKGLLYLYKYFKASEQNLEQRKSA